MELKIRKHSETYIIDVIGEMDLYNSYKLKELVTKMLEKKVENSLLTLKRLIILIPAVSVHSSPSALH